MDRQYVEVADPIPGQMYAWDLGVGTGDWIVEVVTERRRTVPYSIGRHLHIKRDQPFTIVSTDDDGPLQTPTFKLNTLEVVKPRPRRWHVALLGDTLFWLDHDALRFATLVSDKV